MVFIAHIGREDKYMSSKKEDLTLIVATVSGKEKQNLLDALMELSQNDCDFNGENGLGYLWDEAEGFESNMDYLINKVKDIDDVTDMVNTFVSSWIDRDGYYGQYEVEVITHNDEVVAIVLAYTSGC
jgi:hypothetical protein